MKSVYVLQMSFHLRLRSKKLHLLSTVKLLNHTHTYIRQILYQYNYWMSCQCSRCAVVMATPTTHLCWKRRRRRGRQKRRGDKGEDEKEEQRRNGIRGRAERKGEIRGGGGDGRGQSERTERDAEDKKETERSKRRIEDESGGGRGGRLVQETVKGEGVR